MNGIFWTLVIIGAGLIAMSAALHLADHPRAGKYFFFFGIALTGFAAGYGAGAGL